MTTTSRMIETRGATRDTERRTFGRVREGLHLDNWGFDVDGTFSWQGPYSLENVSFQEIGVYISGYGTVIADVRNGGQVLPRVRLTKVQWEGYSCLRPRSVLAKHPDFAGALPLANRLDDALFSWMDLRREYNREGTGTPVEAFTLIEEDGAIPGTDERIIEVGFQHPRYFPGPPRMTFARPYAVIAHPSLANRAGFVARYLVDDQATLRSDAQRRVVGPEMRLSNGLDLAKFRPAAQSEQVLAAYRDVATYLQDHPAVPRPSD